MSTEFKLPDIGEGLEEGEIVKWLVAEGDVVKADQNIVQVETDKAVADLPAPVSGTILKINFKAGDVVKVGQVLCVIGDSGEKVEKEKPEKKINVKEQQTGDDRVNSDDNKDIGKKENSTENDNKIITKSSGKIKASPAVRSLAKKKGIDLASVTGTGKQGQILKSDLSGESVGKTAETEETTEQKPGIFIKKKYDQFGYLERVPLKGIRKTIAVNMVKSISGTAQLTAMDDIDVSKLWELREKEKRHFEIEGIKLTFLPFVVKASIDALKENPILNSSIEGEEIIIKKYFNIGIAVETPAGLMVPVVKIADKKSIAKIAKEITDLAEKARTRTIDIMDMKGSTFTITNYGSVAGTYATPIINPGEAAILGLGRIFDRAVLDEKTKKVKNIKILPISLTFDHRILDGAEASRFLESLKKFLENPDKLFKEIK